MTRLPTRLFPGRVVRVLSLDAVEIDLQLGFGVFIRKAVRLEGIEARAVPKAFLDPAKYCLIVLLGGKRVLVHTDPHRRGRFVVGRVYLDERIHGRPVGMETPFGLDESRLDASAFYAWLSEHKYDVQLVKAILNGDGRQKART